MFVSFVIFLAPAVINSGIIAQRLRLDSKTGTTATSVTEEHNVQFVDDSGEIQNNAEKIRLLRQDTIDRKIKLREKENQDRDKFPNRLVEVRENGLTQLLETGSDIVTTTTSTTTTSTTLGYGTYAVLGTNTQALTGVLKTSITGDIAPLDVPLTQRTVSQPDLGADEFYCDMAVEFQCAKLDGNGEQVPLADTDYTILTNSLDASKGKLDTMNACRELCKMNANQRNDLSGLKRGPVCCNLSFPSGTTTSATCAISTGVSVVSGVSANSLKKQNLLEWEFKFNGCPTGAGAKQKKSLSVGGSEFKLTRQSGLTPIPGLMIINPEVPVTTRKASPNLPGSDSTFNSKSGFCFDATEASKKTVNKIPDPDGYLRIPVSPPQKIGGVVIRAAHAEVDVSKADTVGGIGTSVRNNNARYFVKKIRVEVTESGTGEKGALEYTIDQATINKWGDLHNDFTDTEFYISLPKVVNAEEIKITVLDFANWPCMRATLLKLDTSSIDYILPNCKDACSSDKSCNAIRVSNAPECILYAGDYDGAIVQDNACVKDGSVKTYAVKRTGRFAAGFCMSAEGNSNPQPNLDSRLDATGIGWAGKLGFISNKPNLINGANMLTDQFIVIELGDLKSVTGIVTKGRKKASQSGILSIANPAFVTMVTVDATRERSCDGSNDCFKPVTGGPFYLHDRKVNCDELGECDGIDPDIEQYVIFPEAPFWARMLRVTIKNFYNFPVLRIAVLESGSGSTPTGDCLGQWSESYSTCSADGEQYKSYTIAQEKVSTGAECGRTVDTPFEDTFWSKVFEETRAQENVNKDDRKSCAPGDVGAALNGVNDNSKFCKFSADNTAIKTLKLPEEVPFNSKNGDYFVKFEWGMPDAKGDPSQKLEVYVPAGTDIFSQDTAAVQSQMKDNRMWRKIIGVCGL